MKKLFTNKYIWAAIITVTAIIGYTVFSEKKSNSAKKNRQTAQVERGEFVQRSTIAGMVTPLRKTIITAPYQGYVQKMFVKLGQELKTGDAIASVSPTLVAGDTVFPLRSPFAGKVVQVNKSEGEFVKNSDATDFIVRIDDISKLYINANVPELDRIKMETGMEAIVKASSVMDRTYKGVVRDLSFAAREQDGWGRTTAVEFPMRLEILDFDKQLQPGMSVIVDIITLRKNNVLLLRHEFIGRNKESYFVTTKDGKNLPIKIGAQNEEFSEVLEGVTEGTSVQKVDFSELVKKQ